ncbi:hypothetical protein QBC34DRAFT_34540 [Podospora aff. communis PSN243]|uniref:Secreted protein n=1 Tax=Podospora aff. communis PSN243 TaxID=3040156 RepID=A0AAV9GWK6_9PEZI|nr:hypothetical protein QBC34DRAFT_34540 [Podospora aff. communis PSN243]
MLLVLLPGWAGLGWVEAATFSRTTRPPLAVRSSRCTPNSPATSQETPGSSQACENDDTRTFPERGRRRALVPWPDHRPTLVDVCHRVSLRNMGAAVLHVSPTQRGKPRYQVLAFGCRSRVATLLLSTDRNLTWVTDNTDPDGWAPCPRTLQPSGPRMSMGITRSCRDLPGHTSRAAVWGR